MVGWSNRIVTTWMPESGQSRERCQETDTQDIVLDLDGNHFLDNEGSCCEDLAHCVFPWF